MGYMSPEAVATAKGKFLEHLLKSANISESCRISGASRQCCYNWREADEQFAKAWVEALEYATDTLEAEARRRALDGYEEYVVSGGRLVEDPETKKPLKQRKYSDALMALLLRAHRPEKYKERSQVENTGNVVVKLDRDDSNL